jgi:hypothetical protein
MGSASSVASLQEENKKLQEKLRLKEEAYDELRNLDCVKQYLAKKASKEEMNRYLKGEYNRYNNGESFLS